jgi:hypothetical protein
MAPSKKRPAISATEVRRDFADDGPSHPEPSRPAAEHVADRCEETAADREAAWLERELYEQDSERWEAERDD